MGGKGISLSRLAVGLTIVALALASCGLSPEEQLVSGADTCLGSVSPGGLNTLFDSEPGGVIAADYQRAVALPDGRTLWLFQDATVRLPPPTAPTTTVDPDQPEPPTERLLHNIAMVQSGTCFDLLRGGTAADPQPWLFADETIPFSHWFWPLAATMGSDGSMYVFVAEMVEHGPLYLSTTEPIGTRIVAIDIGTMTIGFRGHPPNDSRSLYGFSITNDNTWTYMYGQCHRQFGWDPGPFGVKAHDYSCAGNVPVARVRKGQLFDAPSYWDGTSWQSDPNRAVAVIPTSGRSVNATQVQWTGTEFVAVTKVDDWFGSTIYLDRAPRAEGPWTNYARMPATPKCAKQVCNTYFASWVPWTDNGRYIIGLSNNRWDGQVSSINRPSFMTAPPPGEFSFALRCSVIDC